MPFTSVIFHADGTYSEVAEEAATMDGVWQPAGARTAEVLAGAEIGPLDLAFGTGETGHDRRRGERADGHGPGHDGDPDARWHARIRRRGLRREADPTGARALAAAVARAGLPSPGLTPIRFRVKSRIDPFAPP